MTFEHRYRTYRAHVERYLTAMVRKPSPHTLYQPARYVLDGGGKRVRSVLVLASAGACGARIADALPASAAIEILHNFTLVHDDIMDNAATRRGRPTVHTRWDSNVALLAGDSLVALAYQALLRSQPAVAQELGRLFTDGLLVVCEGQALDKEFETDRNVSVRRYLGMIEKKTARMISVAVELGAVIAGAGRRTRSALRSYGFYLGRAFQVQDDLLDITADEASFGKRIGGDIIEGKKTFLLLRAVEQARGSDRRTLMRAVRKERISWREIPAFRAIYERTGAIDAARRRVAGDIRRATAQLRSLPASPDRDMLDWFAEVLRERSS